MHTTLAYATVTPLHMIRHGILYIAARMFAIPIGSVVMHVSWHGVLTIAHRMFAIPTGRNTYIIRVWSLICCFVHILTHAHVSVIPLHSS